MVCDVLKITSPHQSWNNTLSGAFRWSDNSSVDNSLIITPAPGITVEKIVIRGQAEGNYTNFQITSNFTIDSSDALIQSWDCNKSEEFTIATSKSYRFSWIELTYSGTTDQPAVPRCSQEGGVFGYNQELTLTCPTDGATMYYTYVDNDYLTNIQCTDNNLIFGELSEGSTKYEGPIPMTEDHKNLVCMAAKDGKWSFFKVIHLNNIAPFEHKATFDFAHWQTLTPALDEEKDFQWVKGTDYSCNLVKATDDQGGVTPRFFTDGNVTLKFLTSEDCKDAVIYKSAAFGYTTACRVYPGDNIEVSVADGVDFVGIRFYGSNLNTKKNQDAPHIQKTEDTPGEYGRSRMTTDNRVVVETLWQADPQNPVKTAKFTVPSVAKDDYVDGIEVFYNGETSGIESVSADAEVDVNAPVRYYNLNGLLLNSNQLAPGIYIRVQGSNASKVLVK